MKVDIFKLLENHYFFMIGVFLIVLLGWQFYSMKIHKQKDKDEDDHWIGGIFYVNPHDFRVFLPKKNGLGYTLNFAHVISKAIISAVISLVVSALLFG